MTLSSDKVVEFTDKLVTNLNALLKKLKGVFLVEDFIESIKFAVGKNNKTYKYVERIYYTLLWY